MFGPNKEGANFDQLFCNFLGEAKEEARSGGGTEAVGLPKPLLDVLEGHELQ